MKIRKLWLCLVILALLSALLTACGKTNVEVESDVTLTFIYCEDNISVILSPEERAKVIEILDGNVYDSVFLGGIPSCSFDKNISLTVGNRTYAIACDTCRYIQDMGNERYFTISKENMDYIHSLFEAYGGYFPCV